VYEAICSGNISCKQYALVLGVTSRRCPVYDSDRHANERKLQNTISLQNSSTLLSKIRVGIWTSSTNLQHITTKSNV